ncbi:MAG: M13 family metallopeptidase [Chlorobi bacterium]|nr:M13 family metallopeptidase [Chlorobiota bacterium]
MKNNYFLLLLIVAFTACQQQPKSTTSMAINPADLDTTVNPAQDFYSFANGGWLKNNPLPADKSRYGTFDELQEDNNKKIRDLVLELSSRQQDSGSIAQKVGDFYALGMDTVTRQKQGIEPIRSILDEITGLRDMDAVESEIAKLHAEGIRVLFRFYGNVDRKNSGMVITHLGQGGLGLSDRDYYVNDDPRSKEIRTAYLDYMKKMFVLTGDEAAVAKKKAADILKLETQLASASMTRLERRDPHKTYHKMTLSDVEALAPNMKWVNYFDGIGLADPGDINVTQPEFFKEVNLLLETIPVDTWKAYLSWHLLDRAAPYLSDDFVRTHFDFWGKVISGTEVMEPRWKRVITTTNRALGEALGQMFVKKYFPPEAKKRMLDLVGNLKSSLGDHIRNLDWMSDTTKKNALEKLDSMHVKIGYPDKWRDYSNLKINRDAYILNILRAGKFNFEYYRDKIGKPTDPNDWMMTPQTVNAYYSPTHNDINFPAGILQPPFFFKDADDAVNYGAIGVVIGHEMTHGFDDQGRQFDKDGNLKDWWTAKDAQKFKERADVLVKQFDSFVVLDTIHANGALTLGENIADLGGLNISFDAFKKATVGKNPGPIDGFTPEQRFFLAYAHVWAQNIRKKEILRRTKEDVHALGRFRVNGPLPNIRAFLDAFDIKPGDAMYLPPEKRAVIW